jgi:dephospho-CoA kinase
MEKCKITAIVGMPGSGKSVAAEFFKSKGIRVLRFGDQTEIGLKEQGLEINEKNERWYREKLRHDLGMAAMAIKIEPRINDALTKNNKVILDGLYSWEEYEYLIKKFPYLKLLCIYSPPNIRHKRLSKRKIRPLTPDLSISRDIAEIINLNKGGPIAMADFLIVNNSTKENFYNDLNKYFDKYI